MNLVATLSVEKNKPIGAMEWYETLAPLIALQLPENTLSPDMTCSDLLTVIMDLPREVRVKILMVEVPSKQEQHTAVQEAKQESHRGMLVGISGVIMVLSIGALFVYMSLTSINGGEVDKEAMGTFAGIVKDLLTVLLAPENGQ